MTSSVGALLPPNNQAPFERALAAGMSDDLPVPIAQTLDPDTAPEKWLPILAFGESVDLWFDDWPVERKRQVIQDWPRLASLVGTRAAAAEFLALVDAQIVDEVSYPTPFVFGQTTMRDGMTIHHPHHKTYFLIKISPRVRSDHFTFGRSFIGHNHCFHTVDDEPLQRVFAALRAAKVPETQYGVDFGWKRPVRFADAWSLGTPRRFNHYIDRNTL